MLFVKDAGFDYNPFTPNEGETDLSQGRCPVMVWLAFLYGLCGSMKTLFFCSGASLMCQCHLICFDQYFACNHLANPAKNNPGPQRGSNPSNFPIHPDNS